MTAKDIFFALYPQPMAGHLWRLYGKVVAASHNATRASTKRPAESKTDMRTLDNIHYHIAKANGDLAEARNAGRMIEEGKPEWYAAHYLGSALENLTRAVEHLARKVETMNGERKDE